MEAFKKTFHSMRSDGRIHKSGSSDEFPEELSTPDDGWEKAGGVELFLNGGGREREARERECESALYVFVP